MMRDFQLFAKPAGAACNLACRYCYYLGRGGDGGRAPAMADDVLEEYIRQHIDACPDGEVHFSWHGGEPTILGTDYFRKIVSLQRKHQRPGQRIANGMQTNGTLLDEEWCRFLAEEHFSVGISLDGPAELHDPWRVTKGGTGSHERVLRGYRLLQQYGVPTDVLCVVHAGNVRHPLEVYRFFREIGARYIGFLPLVERASDGSGMSALTVYADAFGDFLCAVFEEWLGQDIGRIKVQIFEEALAPALGREHGLCIFRKTCGDIPSLERNGDLFPCDHFTDGEHLIGNIRTTPLSELIESQKLISFGRNKFDGLPRYCRECKVLAQCNGGCPKDRLLHAPDSEEGLNYLCAGYRRFFTHCAPFAAQVASLASSPGTRHGQGDAPDKVARPVTKTGRNDPCPCGSGLKYKKCCGR